jgi:hypothetical protein
LGCDRDADEARVAERLEGALDLSTQTTRRELRDRELRTDDEVLVDPLSELVEGAPNHPSGVVDLAGVYTDIDLDVLRRELLAADRFSDRTKILFKCVEIYADADADNVELASISHEALLDRAPSKGLAVEVDQLEPTGLWVFGQIRLFLDGVLGEVEVPVQLKEMSRETSDLGRRVARKEPRDLAAEVVEVAQAAFGAASPSAAFSAGFSTGP